MHPHRNNVLAIGAMILSMLGFVSNDTQVKYLTETLPLGEVMFLRGIATVVFIGILAIAMGAHREWRMAAHPAVFWRTLGEVVASILFLTALIHLPLAEATIIMQAVPLAVTGAAALFLREHVGWRRWTAVAIGFAGVLIVMRPGLEGFNSYAIMVVVSVLFVALRDIATRFVPASVPTVLVVAIASAAVMVTGAVMGLGEDWRMPNWSELPWLIGSALCLLVGYWFVIVAMRTGDMAVTSPARYTVIVWATIYGFLVWGDKPDTYTWIGTALIVATGLYTITRERRLARRSVSR